jgi:hypothetical protein
LGATPRVLIIVIAAAALGLLLGLLIRCSRNGG